MTKAPLLLAWIVTTLMRFGACTRDQTESQGTEKETLGAVNFPTSCNEDVAEVFTRGIALLHSFEYPEARADFQAVAEQDPACGIAHWGVAMTYVGRESPRATTLSKLTTAS